jgi:hypothetical protein
MIPTLNIIKYMRINAKGIPSGNSSTGKTRRTRNVPHPKKIANKRKEK